jgi:hypothetical protein
VGERRENSLRVIVACFLRDHLKKILGALQTTQHITTSCGRLRLHSLYQLNFMEAGQYNGKNET